MHYTYVLKRKNGEWYSGLEGGVLDVVTKFASCAFANFDNIGKEAAKAV